MEMKFIVSAVILVALALSASAERARFDNYRIYSVAIENKMQLQVLKELSETSDSVSLFKIGKVHDFIQRF